MRNKFLQYFKDKTEEIINQPYLAVIMIIAFLFSGFQLYTAGSGLYFSIIQRSIHLMFVLALTYLIYPIKKGKNNWLRIIDFLLAALGVASMIYIAVNYHGIAIRGGIPNRTDIIFGIIAIIVVIEASRRTVGPQLPFLAILALSYTFLGPYLPGPIANRGYSLSRLIGHLYMTTEGVFGIALGASATFVFLFIFLGALLKHTGLDIFLSNIATSVAGSIAGGPAQVAVFSSALFGTISGTAIGNVTSTGVFTIPLMKRMGYKPHFAAAVEAAASTGGQIMPPIMGAAAFIMAEFTGIPYIRIVLAAVVPAILYFLGCSITVYFRALKIGLRGIPKEELPNFKKAILQGGHLIIPLLGIIFLLIRGHTPLYAGFYCIWLTVIISYIRKETRLSFKDFLNVMVLAARNALSVANACAVVGIIIGVISLTGTGVSIAYTIVRLGKEIYILGLLLTALLAMVMGMGLPTTVVYVLMATLAAPALVRLGVPVLSAHLFTFYYALLALVTPPVCLAAYAAAGIAGASPFKTGWTAARIAIAGYIVPFIFIFSPILLFINFSPIKFIVTFIIAIMAIIAIAAGLEGYLFHKMSVFERSILIITPFLLIVPSWKTNILGIALFGAIILKQKYWKVREKELIG